MAAATEEKVHVLIPEEEIREKIEEYGRLITREYAGKKLLVAGILKGSFIFMADLIREIKIPCEVDFMCASSYGKSTVSSGELKVTKDLGVDISEYDVLIAEDILDTGNTLSKVKQLLAKRNPKSLKIITMLDKPSRRTADIEADYTLFTIEDKFVVGMGLDYAERYRNLKFIGEVEL